MADRYWVGGTGNYGDTAHWASTSGGASGAAVPTSADNAYFDANSFSATGQIVTVNIASGCLDMDWTGALFTPTLTGTAGLNIYGNLTLISGMTLSLSTGATNFRATGSVNIDMAGKAFNTPVVFGPTSASTTGVFNFTSNFATTTASNRIVTHTNGTINTNNFTFIAGSYVTATGTKTLNMGSSIFQLSFGWSIPSTTGLTLNIGTSSIRIQTPTSVGVVTGFVGAGLTYNTVTLIAVGSTTVPITGSNTFANLQLFGTIRVNAGTTQTCTMLQGGVNGNSLTILSSTAGTQYTLKQLNPSSVALCFAGGVKDGFFDTSAGATYGAYNATDNGNNTNIIFGTGVSRTDSGVKIKLRDEHIRLSLDNVDGRGTVAAPSGIDMTTAMTIEVTVTCNDPTQDHTVISRNGPFFVRISNSVLRVGIFNSTTFTFANGSIPLEKFTEYHLCLTYDQVNMKGYVNGVLDISVPLTGAMSSFGALYFGYPGVAGEDFPLNGTMREVKLWDYARSQAQIISTMNKPLSADEFETGMVGYWPMDDGFSSSIIGDTSPANHGTLTGGYSWVSPSLSVTNVIGVSDSLPIKFTETPLINNNFDSDDVLSIVASETSALGVSIVSSDNFSILLTEVQDTNASTEVNDTILLNLQESINTDVSSNSTDTLAIKLDESSSYYVPIVGNDPVIITITEIVQVTNVLEKNDTLSIILTDTSSIVNDFTRNDEILLTLSESSEFEIHLLREDTLPLVLDATVEATNTFGKTDTLDLIMSDYSTMNNIHTQMDAPFRRIYGKVEITFSDPFLDESITAVAEQTARWTSPLQTTDNIAQSAYKWFSLQENTLDGSYHAMPSTDATSVGWWSVDESDIDGYFADPLILSVLFEPRPVYNLLCAGDDMLVEFPVDFVIKLYGEDDELLYTETVSDNVDVSWSKALDAPVAPVVKMTLTISRINKGNRTAKINEFYTAVKQTYFGDDILSISLLEEQVFRNVTLPIGNISSNEIDIRIRNVNGQFDPANKQSPLYGLLKKNRRIKAWLGVEIIEGEIEWSPLGQFWSVDWDAPSSGVYVSVSARDRLDLLRYTDFITSEVYHNYTLYQLAEMVLQDVDLQDTQYFIDPSLNDVVVEYSWFDRMSHREALTIIAGAATGRVYCNRDGQIVIDSFITPPDTFYAFTNEKSILNISYPLAWSEITNYVEVTSVPRKLTSLEEVYNFGSEVLTIAPNSSQSETFIFNDLPVTDVAIPEFTASSVDVTMESWEAFAWGIVITFNNANVAAQTVTNITVDGKRVIPNSTRIIVAKDDRSIRDNTKQKYAIENDFIQSSARAQDIADNILATYKDPRHDATLETRGHIALRLGDRVTIPDGANGSSPYFITRQKLEWSGSLRGTIEAQIIRS